MAPDKWIVISHTSSVFVPFSTDEIAYSAIADRFPRVIARIKPSVDGEKPCIFSGEEETGGTIVACSAAPRSSEIAAAYKSDRDLEMRLKEIFPERADVFYFDGVYSHRSRSPDYLEESLG